LKRLQPSVKTPTGDKTNLSLKQVLRDECLPALGGQSKYFSLETVKAWVLRRKLDHPEATLKDSSLKVYLSEAVKQGHIHSAGRGWYSSLSETVSLEPKPVAKLIRTVEKAFPLLDFTVWSTAQINPWMHHLLAHPVAFVHAPSDTLESVGDALRELGWEVAVNPAPSAGSKSARPGEKMVVLRPTLAKQPASQGWQAAIEKILVDLVAEAPRVALMDASDAQGVAKAILSQFLVQLAVLQRYADSRAVTLDEVTTINQRQAIASIGVG
jgi:hypothetical protein